MADTQTHDKQKVKNGNGLDASRQGSKEKCAQCGMSQKACKCTFADSDEEEYKRWSCRSCGLYNSSSLSSCKICGTPKRVKDMPQLETTMIPCPICPEFNDPTAETCKNCQTPLVAEPCNLEAQALLAGEVDGLNSVTPQGLVRSIYGATVQPNGGVLFCVWAPQAEKVYLAGDFNDWNNKSLKMVKNDQDIWELFVAEAKEGQSYHYLIYREGEKGLLMRNDPRATILRANRAVIWNHTDYKWNDKDWVPPPFEKLVVMELHVATFGATTDIGDDGTFLTCINRLDHLASIGINAIELLPITEDYHQKCWGYDPISLFGVHSKFGHPDELKKLVDECHARGIAVIVDWVPNHMSGRSLLHAFDGTNSLGPYFYNDDRSKTDYGPRLDYRSKEVRRWIRHSALAYILDFHMDGIRIDSTNTMRLSYTSPLVEAWTLLQDVSEFCRKLPLPKILIAEDLQGNDQMNYVAGCHSQWDPEFFSILYNTVRCTEDKDRSMHNLANTLRRKFSDISYHRIIYTENHDTVPTDRQNRIPMSINSNPDGDYFAKKRSTLAAAILLTAPGIPMLFSGQEFYDIMSSTWPVPPPLDWGRSKKYPEIVQIYRDLIRLRKNEDGHTKGLTSINIKVYHLNDVSKVLVYYRHDIGGAGDDVIVVVNFSGENYENYYIGLPRPGKWFIRMHTGSKKYGYDDAVGDVEYIHTEDKSYDGFFFSGRFDLSKYTCLILSQDPKKHEEYLDYL